MQDHKCEYILRGAILKLMLAVCKTEWRTHHLSVKQWGVEEIKEYMEENFGEVAEKFVGELAVLNETAKKSCNLSLGLDK